MSESACNATGWICDDPCEFITAKIPYCEVLNGETRRRRHLAVDLLSEDEIKQRRLGPQPIDPVDECGNPLLMPCLQLGNEMTTHDGCCGSSENRILWTEDSSNKRPWMHPHVETMSDITADSTTMELVAGNPGIWKISSLFSDETIDNILAAVQRAGDDLGRFGPCAGQPHAHLEKKECFRLSAGSSHSDDAELIQSVMDELATLWPHAQELEQRDYMYAQRTKPGCDATEVHRDKNHGDMSSATTTTVLYLSDGGAGVYFPHLGTVITPKKGMVVAWINVYPDGEHNPMASHGIQATPDEYEIDRLALTFRINLSEKERDEAALASKKEL